MKITLVIPEWGPAIVKIINRELETGHLARLLFDMSAPTSLIRMVSSCPRIDPAATLEDCVEVLGLPMEECDTVMDNSMYVMNIEDMPPLFAMIGPGEDDAPKDKPIFIDRSYMREGLGVGGTA